MGHLKNSLEATIRDWRNGGSHPFLVEGIFKTREIYRNLMQKIFTGSIITKINNLGPVNNVNNLFRLASRGWYGIISPIQSRIEFTSLLGILSKQRAQPYWKLEPQMMTHYLCSQG